ncbi:hypothetical protein EXIGLDRAFT_718791 [Exidia glandulosa HHB12029]|uniref:Uncharacterized protein n=1 Tax=Exidia glandulosa HHB12029 TaxID=1314781 RepID=A0A165HHU3_EXIGL|nr:hypothetical protein EXIGLDRAFT_718791 [Exidia glandulosa HHB12029]
MIFEHGVWKNALCYREGQRIGLHLAWFIVERNGDLRRVRPRDVERAYVISGVIYNADDE